MKPRSPRDSPLWKCQARQQQIFGNHVRTSINFQPVFNFAKIGGTSAPESIASLVFPLPPPFRTTILSFQRRGRKHFQLTSFRLPTPPWGDSSVPGCSREATVFDVICIPWESWTNDVSLPITVIFVLHFLPFPPPTELGTTTRKIGWLYGVWISNFYYISRKEGRGEGDFGDVWPRRDGGVFLHRVLESLRRCDQQILTHFAGSWFADHNEWPSRWHDNSSLSFSFRTRRCDVTGWKRSRSDKLIIRLASVTFKYSWN